MRLISHVGRAIRKSGHNHTEFARESGIARSTLEKLIGNHFNEIRRDTIERLAARLKITDLNELFSLQQEEQDFVEPFTKRRSVTFVFGTHEIADSSRTKRGEKPGQPMRTTVDLWDFRTQAKLLGFLRGHDAEVRDEMLFFSRAAFGEEEQKQVLNLVRTRNVVIVGSPKVNPACETVLTALYRGGLGIGPRRAGAPRHLLSDDERLKGSVIGAQGFGEIGVVDAQTGRIVAPFKIGAGEESSQDAGIGFVCLRPLGTAEEVMLVIAAGVSGCGTYGVIQSLVDEPPRSNDLAPGVVYERAVSTFYKRPEDSVRDERQVLKVVSVGAARDR